MERISAMLAEDQITEDLSRSGKIILELTSALLTALIEEEAAGNLNDFRNILKQYISMLRLERSTSK